MFAFINYYLIEEKDAKIFHGLNGLLHLLWWGAVWYFTRDWWLVAACPFTGRLLFDTVLNVLRKKGIGYVSPAPKSILDRIEKAVFGNNGILPKVLYAIVVIILVVLHYVK